MSKPDDPPPLLVKARNDALVLDKLAEDPEVADESVGFHAQQAVEKALKAVLEDRGVDCAARDVARTILNRAERELEGA